MDKINASTIKQYVQKLRARGESASVVERKLASVKRFMEWAHKRGIIKDLHGLQKDSRGLEADKHGLTVKSFFLNLIKRVPRKSASPSAEIPKLAIQYYVGLVIILIFVSVMGAGIYNQFFVKNQASLAYPTALTRAGRILSFQGRLTDTLSNPITTATNVEFKLYSVATAGTALYATGTCSTTPDQDGIFSTLIGSDCGAEIASSVFSENTNVYLGVTVGADAEMTPRQQIANVGYAINAETLQGLPPGANTSNIPYINSQGNLLIAASNPNLASTYASSTFTISSAQATTIQAAGTGDIVLQATESGTLKFRTGGATDAFTRIFVDNAGLVGIGDTTPLATLTVGDGDLFQVAGATGNVLTSGTMTAATNETINGIDISSGTVSDVVNLTINTGGDLTIGAIGLNDVGTTNITSGASLVGAFDEFDNSASTTVQDVLDDLDAAITTGGGSSMWSLASGIIYPTTVTNDLAIGGTTLAASMFGIDESAGNFYFGYDNSANPTLNFEATDADAGEFGFNTNDAFFFSNANVGIGDTGPDAFLEVLGTTEQLRLTHTDGTVDSRFTVDASGNLTIDNTGTKTIIADDLQINGGDILTGNIAFTVGDATTDSITLTTDGTGNGEIVLPNDSIGPNEMFTTGQTDEYCLTYEGTGTTWEWQTCGGGAGSGSNWRISSGALSPLNDTLDLLIGSSASSSAKFAFLNVNSGTPTASVSGSLTNVATYLTGDGNLATTNMRTLTLGGSSTGAIQLSPKNTTGFYVDGTGQVGIGTTTPSNELEVNGDVELTNLFDNDASNFFDGGCSSSTSLTGIDSTGAITCTAITGVPASAVSFENITSGTNITAAMIVGAGASLNYTSTGTINASSLIGGTWAAPGTIGSGTPNTGAFTTLSSTGTTTLGDAIGDAVTVNAGAWTFANDTNFALTGGVNGLSFDGTTFSVDALNNRIGIGTATPTDTLEVNGGILGSYFLDHSNTAYGIDPASTTVFGNSISMQISGGALMALDEGKVGIGVTSPMEILDVGGNATVSGNLTFYAGARTIAGRAMNALTIGDSQTGNLIINPGGNIGIGTTSPSTKLEVNGTITSVTGAINSSVASGATAVGFTLNTASLTTQGSKLLSLQNAASEKFYIDKDGNLYAAGTILSGNGTGMLMTNKSGATVAVRGLVIIDTANNSAFTTTTTAYNKTAFGVVTGVGLGVSNDANADGVCNANDICMIAVGGEVNVTTTNASTAAKGDYLFTSATAGSAVASAKQFDGLIGVVSGTANAASGYLKMIFKVQPQVTAAASIDKGSKHNEYWLYANKYASVGEGSDTNANLLTRGLMFDNLSDSTKTDSANTTVSGPAQVSNPLVYSFFQSPAAPYRAGLLGGQTLATSTTDNAGNTYLGSNTVNKTVLYDRTRDSAPQVQVELGLDPNWYNGVTLAVATSSAQFSQNSVIVKNPNLSTTYNGSAIKVTGNYTSNAKTIYITIKSPTSFDWTDYNGQAATAVTITPGTAQTLGGTGVSAKFTDARYNTGDVFKIASWFVEPSGSTRGTKQQFPERSYVVGTASSVDIIDADTQKLWMRFTFAGSGTTTNNMLGRSTSAASSVTALNGKIYVEDTDYYHRWSDFTTDSGYLMTSGAYDKYNGSISQRNSGLGETMISGSFVVVGTTNDVSAAVIPNQPTQTMTVSGWGYIVGAGTYGISETVNLPYKFNNTPIVNVTTSGNTASSIAPTKLSDCVNSAYSTTGKAEAITTTNFLARIYDPYPTNIAATTYVCYTWTATGQVSPRQYVAVATNGGVSLINETDQSAVSIQRSDANDTVKFAKLAADGTLYFGIYSSSIQDINAVYTTNSTWWNGDSSFETNLGDYRYDSGTIISPNIAGAGNRTANDFWVTSGTSTTDGKSNTLYQAKDDGLVVIQEKQSRGTSGDGSDEANGSVKYYTKDYISEEMVGDIRGMWPLSANGAISMSDASVKADTLTNNATATFVTGVRGGGVSFNGTTQYLSCTDAACGGTSKLESTGSTFSFGAWVKTSANNGIILAKYNQAVSGSYQLCMGTAGAACSGGANGKIGVNVFANAAGNAQGNTAINDNNWHFVIGVVDGSKLNVYVDGRLDGSVAQSVNISDSTANFSIGADYTSSSPSNYFTGTIDEPFVTATALTASQIRHMYNVGYRALQSHATTLGGGAADTNQQLGFISTGTNTVGAVGVDYNNQFMYVGTNSTTLGAVSKIDLNSDTNIKTYNSSANVPAGGALLVDEDTKSLAVGYNLEAVGSAASGVKTMGVDNSSTSLTANFVGKTTTTAESFTQAYLWAQYTLDSSDASNTVTVSASNDGGTNYYQCNLTNTDASQSPTEYEYFCQFNAPGSSLKTKFALARGSTKTNTYVTRYGIAWIGSDAIGGAPGGNGLYTNNNASVASGSYIDVAHNQNSNDVVTDAWVNLNGQWKSVSTATESGIISASNASVADGSYVEVVHNQQTSDILADGWKYNSSTSQWEKIDNGTAATGGTLTYSGGYTIHTFTTSGTFTPNGTGNVEYLVVAGGGGAEGGGGGAGGMLTGTTAVTSAPVTVTVGAGGSGGATNGNNSVFGSLTAIGGGRGASYNTNGSVGGSGGGAATSTGISYTGGAGTASQGNNGGNATGGHSASGGGGGAGAVGANTTANTGGNGGAGTASSISGSSVTYAGGGGGGGFTAGGSGGSGGGGNGSSVADANSAGTANTGGGGGGGYYGGGKGGGSGIVIIRYQTNSLSPVFKIVQQDANTVRLYNYSGSTQNLRLDVSTQAFQVRQQDANTVRLYNYSGSAQNLRLDVITGGLGRNAGTVSLAPAAADTQAQDNTNAIWVNQTGSGGNLLKLQIAGVDKFLVDSSGNVGVGTTTPLAKLHVEGQCVAMGTLIRRRRRKRRKSSDDDDDKDNDYLNDDRRLDNLEFEDIPVEDIEAGDEVLTLNEQTNDFEWQTVEKTMDMGMQKVFGIKTASGKYIRVTDQHPFLIQVRPPKIVEGDFEVDISGRVEEMNKDTFIALANNINAFVIKLAAREKRVLKLWHSQRKRSRFGFQIYASLIVQLIFLSGFKVRRLIIDHDYQGNEPEIKALITKTYPQLIIEFKSVGKGSPSDRAAYRANTKNIGIDCRLKVEDYLAIKNETRGACAPNVSHHAEWLRRFALTARSQNPLYSGLKRMSRGKFGETSWIKTAYLKPGMRIATVDGFEYIISVDRLNRVRTFDLQIANTHNFVANKIVAHNTYLKGADQLNTSFALRTADSAGADKFVITNAGNVGIGTTGPGFPFEISKAASVAMSLTRPDSVNSIFMRYTSGSSPMWANGMGITSTADKYQIYSYTLGNAAVTIDNAGNVGIGTTGPGFPFEISKAASVAMSLTRPDSVNSIFMRYTSGSSPMWANGMGITSTADKYQIYSYTLGNAAVTIDNAGNVGIGTTGPISRLGIRGNTEALTRLILENTAGGTTSFSESVASGANSYAYWNYGGLPSSQTPGITLQTEGTGAGNVGIGTTAPNYKLEVDGTSDFGDTMTLNNGAAGSLSWGSGPNFFVVKGNSGYQLRLGANNSNTQVTIDTSGNVGIGIVAPAQQVGTGTVLQVSGGENGSEPALVLGNYSNQTAGNRGRIDFVGTANNGNPKIAASVIGKIESSGTNTVAGALAFETINGAGPGGTEQMRITSAGNVGIGTTGPTYQLQLSTDSAGKPNGGSWANSSDLRLKTDIATYSGALSKLTQLRGVNFNWINPAEHGGYTGVQGGFIAQEVEKIFPSWVQNIDPSGADVQLVGTDEKVKSLSLPFEFDALVVEAIKEQQGQIASLSATINNQQLTISNLSLTTTGDLQIVPAADSAAFVYSGNLDNNFQFSIFNFQSIFNDQIFKLINTKTGETIKRVAAFSQAAIASLRAGAIQAEQATIKSLISPIAQISQIISETIVAKMVKSERIVSPIVETADLSAKVITTADLIATGTAQLNAIATNEIKPQNGDLVVDLGGETPPQTGENTSPLRENPNAGALARLIIRGLEGKTVTTLDAYGNASFSGTIVADSLQINNDATVSGTLVAKEIQAENISDLTKTVFDQRQSLTDQSTSINDIQALLADIKNQPIPDPNYYQNLDSNVQTQNFASLQTESLTVTGQSNLYSVSVANSLLVGTTMIDQNSIISLASELKLSALSTINLFDGSVIIARDGTITTQGEIIAQGGIRTNEIKPLTDDGQVTINNLTTNNLSISDKYLEATDSAAIIAAADNFAKNGIFAPAIETATASAGIAILPENSSEVVIYNNNIKKDSLIYLTPTSSSPTNTQLTVVKKEFCSEQIINCKKYFKVGVDSPINQNNKFNWLIIN